VKYIALLRAVNVAGRNLVAMSDLRATIEQLGFTGVRTLLQSGNVVFQGPRASAAALERKLEAATAKELGVTTDYVVRTADEWQASIAKNPFPDEAKHDPSHLVVMPLKSPPNSAAVQALEAAIRGPEQIAVRGRELYATYPAGIGRSKLTVALIERKLGAVGTGRNWNTVLKLAALVEEIA